MKFSVPLLLVLASCQAIYDFDQFEPETIDPTALEITAIDPPRVLEGAGCRLESAADGSIASDDCAAESPGVVVVVEGANIAPDALVTLDGHGFEAEIISPAVASDGARLAFTIPIAVDRDLEESSADVEVTVTVSQTGAQPMPIVLAVGGLDEFKASDFLADGGDPVSLRGASLFSVIEIDAPLDFSTTTPTDPPDMNFGGVGFALFEATAHISITGDLNGTGAGCLGGANSTKGRCASGGGSGGPGVGAGGGGNSVDGDAGGNGDNGGPKSTAELLAPLSESAGGGGGGANSALPGGAGGAALGFSSGGNLTISSAVNLDGITGEKPAGLCTLGVLDRGGTGGGAGGALFLRAAGDLQASQLSVSVAAGPGGSSDGSCDGGDGAAGQLRIDASSLTLPGGTPTPPAGPVALDPSLIATTATHTIDVAGTTGSTYWITINNAAAPAPFVMSGPIQELALELEPGLNPVCLLSIEAGNRGLPESVSCFDIAYLP